MHEEEALRRGSGPGLSAVATVENLFHLLDRPVATADVDEGSHDASDHVVKEAVGFYFQMQSILDPFYIQMGDGSHRGFAVGPFSFKAAEVVLAEQAFGCAVHGYLIELADGVFPAIAAMKDIGDTIVVDNITVHFLFG